MIVSRIAYDLALEQLRKAEQRADAAEARYHQLRLRGAQEPAPPVARESKEQDPMVALINEKAGSDRGLRARMLQQLRSDRNRGRDETEIQREIEHGIPSAGIP